MYEFYNPNDYFCGIYQIVYYQEVTIFNIVVNEQIYFKIYTKLCNVYLCQEMSFKKKEEPA